MACIKKCMEWLTDYAFVYIAIYGISFIEAGLEVKDLVVSKGLDAIAQAHKKDAASIQAWAKGDRNDGELK